MQRQQEHPIQESETQSAEKKGGWTLVLLGSVVGVASGYYAIKMISSLGKEAVLSNPLNLSIYLSNVFSILAGAFLCFGGVSMLQRRRSTAKWTVVMGLLFSVGFILAKFVADYFKSPDTIARRISLDLLIPAALAFLAHWLHRRRGIR